MSILITKYSAEKKENENSMPLFEITVENVNEEKYVISIGSHDNGNNELTSEQLHIVGEFFTHLSMAITILLHIGNKNETAKALQFLQAAIYTIIGQYYDKCDGKLRFDLNIN